MFRTELFQTEEHFKTRKKKAAKKTRLVFSFVLSKNRIAQVNTVGSGQ